MNDHALAALFVLAVWWLSTSVVLGMVWLARSTFRTSVTALGVLAVVGLYGLFWSRTQTSAASAYLAFSCAVAVWGFHELTFLLGLVTGPRKEPCPTDARGWTRFRYATATVIHHEIALALTLLTIAALTWRGPNRIGMWTFTVLWSMRLSAKLNVFLGVRNVSEEFIPAHLRYLLTYFRRARFNLLMPFSVLAASAMVVRLGGAATASDAPAFLRVGQTLVATILALAVVEHVFLALPVPDALLWRWAIRTKRREDAPIALRPPCPDEPVIVRGRV